MIAPIENDFTDDFSSVNQRYLWAYFLPADFANHADFLSVKSAHLRETSSYHSELIDTVIASEAKQSFNNMQMPYAKQIFGKYEISIAH